MSIRWNQVAVAAASGFLLGAVFSDFYHMHRHPGHPPPPMQGPMEMFARELELTAPQQGKISAIFEKYQPEMEKVMEANRPKIEAVRLKMQAELKSVRTHEQAAKLENMEKDFGPHGHDGPGGPPPHIPHGPGDF